MAALREGVLAVASLAGCPDDTTYLAVAPDGQTLYAVHELADGLVSAFAIGEDGNRSSAGLWAHEVLTRGNVSS